MKKTYLFSLLAALFLITSCDNEDSEPVALEVQTVTNFSAPGDVFDFTTQPPTLLQENPMKYFDFSTGTEVTSSDDWDIGIKGTTIHTNSGINGSGGVQATTVSAIFDNLMTVPAGTTFGSDTNDALAINRNTEFEDRWYSYSQGVISPVPGKVILLKDTEDNYIKMEIQCYYLDCPTNPVPGVNNGVYTFRYIYQPDGTDNFDVTSN